jgi:transposase
VDLKLTRFRGHLILTEKESDMPTPKPPYPAELRQQMVELVHAGRTPAQLAREFDVTAQSIASWVAQAAADSSKPVRGKDVLSTVEREELARLRRENKQLKLERDILAKATAWFAGKGDKTSIGSSNS